MDENKQRQEVSLIGRMLSMEVLLFVMGVASLSYGLLQGTMMNVILGIVIFAAIALLFLLNRKSVGNK